HGPHPRSLGDYEQIEIAVRLEIQMRNAAGQRDQSRVRDRAEQTEHALVAAKERVAARFTALPLADQIDAASRKKEAVAIIDHLLQRLAAVVDGEDLVR